MAVPTSDAQHKADAPPSVRCYIITVSDTRTPETDSSGRAIEDLLTAAGHVVDGRTIVKDNPDLVRDTVIRQLATPGLQAIITTGGTGIAPRDVTPEATRAVCTRILDGFAECMRAAGARF